MNISRRNFLAGAGAIGVSAAVSGCKYPPSDEKGRKIGVGVGGATGLVLDACGLDDESRNATIEIVTGICTTTPQEGETIEQCWTRIAEETVKRLQEAGKLTSAQAAAVLAAFKLVIKAWQILEERHPEVKAWCSFTVAVVNGFCTGFLAVYKPANCNGGCDEGCCEIDMQAYKALQTTAEAKALGFGK